VEGHRSTGVVVIGGGIAGLLTATLLARRGANVLVLDRYEIGGIATRNSTAKISALQGTAYRTITRRRGSQVAAAYALAQLDALAGYRELAGDLGVAGLLVESPAFTYATEPAAAERAHDEHEVARAAGLAARWVTDTELPFDVIGAVRLDHQLHLDPGSFCAALAERLGPARLAGASPVVEIQEGRTGCTLTLANGGTVSAEHAVITTQAPIVDPAFLVNRCRPMQSYAIAAALGRAVPTGLYLSCDEQVRSLRPAIVDGVTVAVVGGEGHPMGSESADPARWAALARWTAEHFGDVEVKHRWATHDLVPTDHVPFIGRLQAGSDRRWVATGFAKWGMTNADAAARLISEGMAGREVEWGFAFDSTRLRPSINRELASAGRTAAARIVIDRIARRPEPRCTHQGCVLRKDAALDTWDCPCHGSRFSAAGDVVQGPATTALDFGSLGAGVAGRRAR
jgi:glycine/D-amino acid oxidase-like deaminating enzyme